MNFSFYSVQELFFGIMMIARDKISDQFATLVLEIFQSKISYHLFYVKTRTFLDKFNTSWDLNNRCLDIEVIWKFAFIFPFFIILGSSYPLSRASLLSFTMPSLLSCFSHYLKWPYKVTIKTGPYIILTLNRIRTWVFEWVSIWIWHTL